MTTPFEPFDAERAAEGLRLRLTEVIYEEVEKVLRGRDFIELSDEELQDVMRGVEDRFAEDVL